MSEYILQVKNLSVDLANAKIINDLSFEVAKGDFLTIVGSNGSGKTVLLKTLLGLITEYKGEINWQSGIKIGYLPQGLTQLKVQNLPLTVKEFLDLKKVEDNKILEYLKLVGIVDKNILKKQMGNLSGGQFQRILMVWALMGEPDVLLFDEPTTGVDMSGEKTIYNLLHKFWQEKHLTILLITHDLSVVYKHSNSVLCMAQNNSCHASPHEISPEKLAELYQMPVKFYEHRH